MQVFLWVVLVIFVVQELHISIAKKKTAKELIAIDPSDLSPQFESKSIEKPVRETSNWFFFDPNLLSDNQLKKLPFSSFYTNNLLKYRQKGGRFYGLEDLKKIYGFESDWLSDLQHYARFTKTKATEVGRKLEPSTNYAINSMDSLDWISLEGIGPVFASRIMKYRRALGGFVHWKQLEEVYGLDSAVVRKYALQWEIDSSAIAHINFNEVGVNELKRHPYISRKMAQHLVNFRKHRGPLKDIHELQESHLIDPAFLTKIAPYLKVE